MDPPLPHRSKKQDPASNHVLADLPHPGFRSSSPRLAHRSVWSTIRRPVLRQLLAYDTRETAYHSDIRPGRHGAAGIEQRREDLVIIALANYMSLF
jgi:hypothetical protein